MSMKPVLSHLSGRQVDTFYALLISESKYSYLPELHDIFGRDATIKFMEIFSGCTVRVPSIKKLSQTARAVVIYVRIEQAKSNAQLAIVKALAEEYEITEDRVRSIYAKTKVKLEDELGFKVVGRS